MALLGSTNEIKHLLFNLYNQRRVWHWNYLDFGRSNRVFESQLRSALKSAKSGHLLDFGCGEHQPNRKVVIESGWKYVGLDIVKGEGVVIRKPSEHFPVEENEINVVICNAVIFLLSDMDLVFREVTRVLKPGGICIFTTPILSPLSTESKVIGSKLNETTRLMPGGIEGFLNLYGLRNSQIQYTPGGLGTICGLFLYFLWVKVFKSDYNRIRWWLFPLFPLFVVISFTVNMVGILIDRFFGDVRFSSLFCVTCTKDS